MINLYYVYITTSPNKRVLYIGITNDLVQRILEHYMKRGCRQTFAGKYSCYNLIYFEEFSDVRNAIAREKELKGWKRSKKDQLIAKQNPFKMFLNHTLFDMWPPPKREQFHRENL